MNGCGQDRRKQVTGILQHTKQVFVSLFVQNNPYSFLHNAGFLLQEHFVSKLHTAQHESFLSCNCLLIIVSPLLPLFLDLLIPDIQESVSLD